MKNLLKKEILLSMHPTALIFLSLSMMLLIPNYPYYVTFFYTGLAVFFTCLNGRENNDVCYTLSLPVSKKSIVKARFSFVILLELAQVLIAVPFAALRQAMPLPGNQVGMDANVAFFGLSFLLLGIFNDVFFTVYYKDVTKVGKAFALSSIAETFYIILAESCVHAIPFFRDKLDTPDSAYLSIKLVVLFVGIAFYIVLTGAAYQKSVKNFDKLDV